MKREIGGALKLLFVVLGAGLGGWLLSGKYAGLVFSIAIGIALLVHCERKSRHYLRRATIDGFQRDISLANWNFWTLMRYVAMRIVVLPGAYAVSELLWGDARVSWGVVGIVVIVMATTAPSLFRQYHEMGKIHRTPC